MSPVDSAFPWQTETPLLFSQVRCAHLSRIRLGSLVWGLDPTFLSGNLLPLKYPCGALAAGSGAGPFRLSALPRSLCVASFANPWL